MARVIFYEKPGCQNNTKQKTLLAAAGHELETYNLLKEAWTVERLRLFFSNLPVVEWFNRTAPRIKSGEVVPEQINEETALSEMVNDPVLIRRPLIQVGDRREVGFDVEKVDAWIGLKPVDESLRAVSENLLQHDLQNCSHGNDHQHNHGKGGCKH
ncbi:MAG: nitrogenase-associated protein [Rhizonema sp. PD37]|nr:nitrogenase-associated protein [Rhizonema sp. PD37]